MEVSLRQMSEEVSATFLSSPRRAQQHDQSETTSKLREQRCSTINDDQSLRLADFKDEWQTETTIAADNEVPFPLAQSDRQPSISPHSRIALEEGFIKVTDIPTNNNPFDADESRSCSTVSGAAASPAGEDIEVGMIVVHLAPDRQGTWPDCSRKDKRDR